MEGITAAILAPFVLFLFYEAAFLWRARRISQRPPSARVQAFDAVVTHTYCPKHSKVPKRGERVAGAASRLAYDLNIPLILAVGHTVPGEPQTESEIYRYYIEKHFANHLPAIVLGQNPDARDTHAETREAARIAKERGWRRLVVMGLAPHLVRIRGYWREYERDFALTFIGVTGPQKYYLWESLMFLLEKLFPPNSKRRAMLLDLVGRKK